ncbi:MAG: PfkB family carbohydrate kinase, partial [Actinobacteria bacterium]|nr:PfkB family carbohydrate kinase [Actinomycetota bacterium]
TGFIGGRKGDQIVADLNDEGILSDFVHIDGESRTYTAVVDSANGVVTEINEHGPEIRPDEFERIYDKLDYLGKAADVVVLAGSLPRGLEDDCYAKMIQRLRQQDVKIAFYTYGDPLKLGIKAGPDLVFPKLVEAEKVIGYEFNDVNDEMDAARSLCAMGAGSAIITSRYKCVAHLTDETGPHTYLATAPRVEVISPMGWGDALVAGYCARMLEGDSPVDCLRFGLGCGAANLTRYGAGVFLPDEAAELAKRVDIQEVSR